jgi:quercetin dioxygenase-like cupin family protein
MVSVLRPITHFLMDEARDLPHDDVDEPARRGKRMSAGQRWQRAHLDRLNDETQRIYGIANLPGVIQSFPPDPDSNARHRANILVKTDTIRVVLVTMLKDGELQEHAAPGPITVQVLSGSIEFSVEGETHAMQEGDLISLAPGVRHAIRGVEDGAFLLTIGVFLREPDRGGRRDDIESHDRFLEPDQEKDEA